MRDQELRVRYATMVDIRLYMFVVLLKSSVFWVGVLRPRLLKLYDIRCVL